MASVSLSRRAERDLRELADWIARDNPAAALSFVAELRVACSELASFPRRFPSVPHLAADVRRRTYGSYHIIYRVRDDDVIIVAVTHAARNPDMSF